MSTSTLPAFDRPANGIQPEQHLWSGRIPSPGISIFAGPPMGGRESVLVDMAARLTTGEPWPDRPEEYREPISVVFSGRNVGLHFLDTMAESGANTARVHIHSGKFKLNSLTEWTKCVRKGAAVVFENLWCYREAPLFNRTHGGHLGGDPSDAVCRKWIDRIDRWSLDHGVPVILDMPFMNGRKDVEGILRSIRLFISDYALTSLHVFTNNESRPGRFMHTVPLRGEAPPDLGFWHGANHKITWYDPASYKAIAHCVADARAMGQSA